MNGLLSEHGVWALSIESWSNEAESIRPLVVVREPHETMAKSLYARYSAPEDELNVKISPVVTSPCVCKLAVCTWKGHLFDLVRRGFGFRPIRISLVFELQPHLVQACRQPPRSIASAPRPQFACHNTLSPVAMRPLTQSAGTVLRSWTRHALPAPRIASAAAVHQRRSQTSGEVGHVSSFDSPFRTNESPSTTKIPSFSHYMSKSPEISNRVFQYFVVGSMGLLAAAGAKATVQGEQPTRAL